eukprot:766408-Hanusia_phi.AAC.9
MEVIKELRLGPCIHDHVVLPQNFVREGARRKRIEQSVNLRRRESDEEEIPSLCTSIVHVSGKRSQDDAVTGPPQRSAWQAALGPRRAIALERRRRSHHCAPAAQSGPDDAVTGRAGQRSAWQAALGPRRAAERLFVNMRRRESDEHSPRGSGAHGKPLWGRDERILSAGGDLITVYQHSPKEAPG